VGRLRSGDVNTLTSLSTEIRRLHRLADDLSSLSRAEEQRLDPPVPLPARVDPDRVTQVLTNLLGNPIRRSWSDLHGSPRRGFIPDRQDRNHTTMPTTREPTMMGYGWGMGPAGWIFMGLFWVVVLGLAVWAVVALLSGPRPGGRDRAESPWEILDRPSPGRLNVEQLPQIRAELAGRSPDKAER
jgi:hypothetical protein